MTVHGAEIKVSTGGDGDAVDLTGEVRRAVEAAAVAEGLAVVFVLGSTAAITTMEHEPGGVHDLREMLERLIPSDREYEHNRLNADTNSHAHQRASLIGPSLAVPVSDGRPTLGVWQQIVLLDFDDRPRERTVLVRVLG